MKADNGRWKAIDEKVSEKKDKYGKKDVDRIMEM